MTVADKEGNMVSLIQSNYRGMGSGMSPPGLGFVLQDSGELFRWKRDISMFMNQVKGLFIPLFPAFITKDGKPWISFGVMGGAMQPQGHAQIVINIIDFGMNLQEAGDAQGSGMEDPLSHGFKNERWRTWFTWNREFPIKLSGNWCAGT